MKLKITEDMMTPCPICGHAHPGGIGLMMCDCKDCSLFFTDIPFEYLAPAFQDRLNELRSISKKKAAKASQR